MAIIQNQKDSLKVETRPWSTKISSFLEGKRVSVEHKKALGIVPVGKICFLAKEEPRGNDFLESNSLTTCNSFVLAI